MLVFGVLFTMPQKYKNFPREVLDEEEFLRRVRLATLWMRVFYGSFYPIALIVLFAMGVYIFCFGTLYSDVIVCNGVWVFVLVMCVDWVAWELVVNLISGMLVACAVKKGSCWSLAVVFDCLKGYRNVSI